MYIGLGCFQAEISNILCQKKTYNGPVKVNQEFSLSGLKLIFSGWVRNWELKTWVF